MAGARAATKSLVTLALLVSALASAQAEAPAPETFTPSEGLVEYATVGSKLAQTTMRTPASVTVITAEQLYRGGFNSVAEALATIPGFFVSDDLQNSNVAVRGVFGGARAGSRSLRVLIDGVPVGYQQSGVNFLGPELIPLSAIERIEVLKGAASALYGTGALVGAINIVTRRPAYEGDTTLGLDVRARGALGAQRGGGGELSATVTAERFAVLIGLTGDWLDRSGLEAAAGPFSAKYATRGASRNDTTTPLAGVIRVDGAVLGGRLTALGAGTLLDRGAEFHDLTVLSHDTRVSALDGVLSVQYDRPFASGFGFAVRGGANFGAVGPSEQYNLGTASSFFLVRRAHSSSYNAALEGRFDAENGGGLLLGVEYTRDNEALSTWVEVDKTSRAQAPRATPPPVNIDNIAAYLTGQYPLLSWLNFAGGLRFDHNSSVGNMFGARAGLVFTLGERASIKALFGRSHRAPSPEQLYGVPGTFLDICGPEGAAATSCPVTTALRPQYLTGGEIIGEVFLTSWLTATLNGYGNRLENNLVYLTRGTALVPTPFNATQFGGEGQMRMALPAGANFTIDASLGASFQNTMTDQSIISGFLQKDVPNNEAVPTEMAFVTAGFRFAPIKLSAFIEYRFVGPRTPSQSNLRIAGTADMDQPVYRLAAYHVLNATVGVTAVKFSETRELGFRLRVTNMLNSKWSEIGFNGVDVPSLGTTAWLMGRLVL